MKIASLFFMLILAFWACNNTKISTGKSNIKSSMNMNYYILKVGENLSDFVDQKICFEAKISEIPAQHMMKMSLNDGEEEKHEYLDPDSKYKGNQIVGYFYPSKVKFPENKKAAIKVYGSLHAMSGKGKGGGTHREYYLDLDKVEALESGD
jgi:hypothetical protein